MLNIPAIKLPDGSMSEPSAVDLSQYFGRAVRVYVTTDGAVVINPRQDTYWQVAEVRVPPQARTDDGDLLPLDYAALEITRFEAPK